MYQVILLSGKRYAGKDTFADCLFRSDPTKYVVVALADLVREEYIAKYKGPDRLTNQILKSNDNNALKEKHRPGLIALAENQKKQHGMDYWSKRLYETQIRNKHPGEGQTTERVYVISDWRFLEEYMFFANLPDVKVLTVRIEASMETRKKRGFVYDPVTDTSRSETNLDSFPFDHVVTNDDTVDTLMKKVLKIFLNQPIAQRSIHDKESKYSS